MNPRNAVLIIAATTVLLQAFDARAQATNPPYLSQMPSTERVTAEVKGADAMGTAARQMGAFWQLMQIIQELAGQRLYRNQLTPDEGRLLGQYRLGYSTAEQPYAHIPKSPSHPDKAKWFKAHTFYENDPGFRDELLDKFFTEEFRAAYYRATGRPRPSNRPQGDPPAAAAAKPPSTGGPTGGPANTSSSAPAGSSAEDYLAQGHKYREAKNYAAAVEAYKKSVSLQPSVGAYSGLGVVYLDGLKQPENALAAFQQVVRLKPDDAGGHLNLGVAYYDVKQFENAVGAFREAIRLKPDYADAFNQLGNAHSELERYPEAAAAFQQAVRLTPNDGAYRYNLGITYVELGNKEEALKVLPALRKLDPTRAEHLDRGINALNPGGGDTPERLLEFGLDLSVFPKTVPNALRLFRRVILLNRDPKSVADAYYQIGSIYGRQGKKEKAAAAHQQAVSFYQQALRAKPNDAGILYELGFTYFELGKKQEMLEVYARLQRLDRKKAQELYAAINKAPSPQPAAGSGNAASPPAGGAGRPPGQRANARPAPPTNTRPSRPANAAPGTSPGPSQPGASAGGSSEAYTLDDADMLAEFCDASFRRRDYERALEMCHSLVRLKPDDADAHELIGFSYYHLKQYSNALATAQQLVRLRPKWAEGPLLMGMTYNEMLQPERALGPLREALRLDPSVHLASYELGKAYWALNQYPNAVAALQQAIRLQRDDVLAHYLLGLVYLDMGRKNEALQVYQRLLSIDKESAQNLWEKINKMK